MYSLIWWSLMWRPGKSSIPLVAETNQQLGRTPSDRQTGSSRGLETRRRWRRGLRSGYALPSTRLHRQGLILIVVGFSLCLSAPIGLVNVETGSLPEYGRGRRTTFKASQQLID